MRFHFRLIILLSSLALLLLTLAAFLLHRHASSANGGSSEVARNDALIRQLLSLVEDPERTAAAALPTNASAMAGAMGIMPGVLGGYGTRGVAPPLTFNIALALAVSMLSMALLITGICCKGVGGGGDSWASKSD
jgi:hypothetical protein